MAQCTATSKQSGERCRKPASPGYKVCHIHGGKTPRGVNSPHFKHGRYSKDAPTALAARYRDAMQDTELLDQRASIAMLDALIGTILPNIDTNDSGEVWKTMKRLVIDCRMAYQSENYGGLEKALHNMEDLADRRVLHYASVEETRVLLDSRRKHVETIEKLNLMSERAISADQVMLLMSQVLSVIQSVVTDREQRYAIASQIQRIVSLPAGGAGAGGRPDSGTAAAD